ncbi:Tim44/TimA family putative adaptor protein [Telmatospirillum sp. J64-1]|uniref:Tim44/TimA family putative adaptor protein n=1 Tax=Telmatospirillum sp. J64-1 TaxID=2502183 RepID=UPI00115E499B|nr:Tim44/TimA family putative adaptor protein [Telmatospirillum sp. J64-1]
MNGSFQFIDIIFFAMVAAFLVLRLRSVLGRRTGNERPPQENPYSRRVDKRGDNVVDLPNRKGDMIPEAYRGTPVEAGLTQIKLADPAFSPDDFLMGARQAFEMIVTAYARGDAQTLRPLLSDEVYGNFMNGIDARERAGETMEFELVGIRKTAIEGARMEGNNAFVTVHYTSEQVSVIRDAEGHVVEGDPNQVSKVDDVWTFARDTTSPDPAWFLVETTAVDEEV